MVQYLSIRPSLISFFIVVGFFLSLFVESSQSHATNRVVDISVICDRIRYAIGDHTQFCERILNSTPAGPHADLLTLAMHTTDVLRSNATNIIGLIHSLIEKTKDNPKDTLFLQMCLYVYSVDGVLVDIDAMQRFLKSKDYSAVHSIVIQMGNDSGECLHKEEPPRHLPLLQDYGDEMNKVAYILQTILFFLEAN